MTVLILARDLDPTADRMVTALGERGVEVFRVNTAWFPTRLQVSVELCNGRWCGVLTAPHATLDLDAVRAVWYRSPEAYGMPPELSPAEAHHARVEAKYGLGGVLASLPVLWCNHPARVADSAYKRMNAWNEKQAARHAEAKRQRGRPASASAISAKTSGGVTSGTLRNRIAPKRRHVFIANSGTNFGTSRGLRTLSFSYKRAWPAGRTRRMPTPIDGRSISFPFLSACCHLFMLILTLCPYL